MTPPVSEAPQRGLLATAIGVVAIAIGSFDAWSASRRPRCSSTRATSRHSHTEGQHWRLVSHRPALNGQTTIHEVRVYSTGAVPAGTVYLLAGGSVLFYRRGPEPVDSGYTNDDFSRNQSTLRVEERVLPAVVRPSLVMKVTLT